MGEDRYRPEIDGLRAVAVLSVLLFHADVAGFSGGYLGVDVFFVISGYLITRNVLDARDKGAFTFGGFYLRRGLSRSQGRRAFAMSMSSL
jgi:peptidoglycan/LPS O-acetylase OafA/YrhL